MDATSAFLNAIPSAATSPLAMVMYLATLAAWVFVKIKVDRLSMLMANLSHVPDKDKAKIVKDTLDEPVPDSMAASEFIIYKKHRYVFFGAIASMATVIIILAISAYKGSDARDRADNLIGTALTNPPSKVRSARSVLSFFQVRPTEM